MAPCGGCFGFLKKKELEGGESSPLVPAAPQAPSLHDGERKIIRQQSTLDDEGVPTVPITLDIMQGPWVNSVGAKILITGTEVSLNGSKMTQFKVNLNEDGTVDSVGTLWQLAGWVGLGKIEFKETPTREGMHHARSVIWSRSNEQTMLEWEGHMKRLGYGGSSKDPLNRGIEGCVPGSMDAGAKMEKLENDPSGMRALGGLLKKWKEPGLSVVRPGLVIPDYSNRGQTGLSVEHVHYLAARFKSQGFKARKQSPSGDLDVQVTRNRKDAQGHDIPVLVRETPKSELGKKSIDNWRNRVRNEEGFPPMAHYEKAFKAKEIFTSLGNGHFNQALNLYANSCKSIYTGETYIIGQDQKLRDAIEVGVPAIILKAGCPLKDREAIAEGLNAKFDFKWQLKRTGSIDFDSTKEDTRQYTQFEAISKVLDAVELDCLVRSELGITDSKRIGH